MNKSIKILISQRSLTRFTPRFFAHSYDPDNVSDQNSAMVESHQQQARQFFKDFSRKVGTKNINEYKLLKQTIFNLYGCKLGISLSDPHFLPFIKDFTSCFKRLTSFDQLLDIMREMMLFELRSEFFYRETFDFLWSLKPELQKSDASYLGFFFTLMQGPYKEAFMHRHPESSSELSKLLVGMRNSQNTAKLPLEGLVELLSLNLALNMENELFLKLFQEKLMPRYKEILRKSSPFFLSNVSLVLHKSYYEPFPQKEAAGQLFKLINELNETAIYNDLSNYDTGLQNYEFTDFKPEEIGFKDFLSFKTLNNLLSVFSDTRFLNEDLVLRVEDAVIRKSETDLADIRNAADLIYNLARFQCSGPQALIRLLEMLILVLDEELPHLGMFLTRGNVMKIIDGVGMVGYRKKVDSELLIEVLEIIAGKVSGGEVRLGGGFGKEDWGLMRKIYGMGCFGGSFKDFIGFIDSQTKEN